MNLNTPVENLRYVGKNYLPRLKKLGIKTVKDLLYHFPARYEDWRDRGKAEDVKPNEKISLIGKVVNIENKRIFPRRIVLTRASIEDETGKVNAVWYNQPFLVNSIKPGKLISLSGKVKLDKYGVYLQNPAYEMISEKDKNFILDFASRGAAAPRIGEIEGGSPAKRDVGRGQSPLRGLKHTAGLIPVYPETEGLTSRYLRFLIKPLLKFSADAPEFLSKDILERQKLYEVKTALNEIHFPSTLEKAEDARRRFAFDELFLFQLKALSERRKIKQQKAAAVKFNQEIIKSFVSSLPFELTGAQKIALWEILKDLEKPYPMNRLLNGDVGSGKTVVAAAAALELTKAGFQTAIMAPTEVLANQHFHTLCGLLRGHNIRVGLITGSGVKERGVFKESVSERGLRENFLDKVENGEVDILVGTHSLIQKNVKFKNLALVVIDEQHRFGVDQRASLIRVETPINTQTDVEDKLLYRNLTYKIRKIIFDVSKKLGPGHKESIYQKALEIEFREVGLNFEKEKQIPIVYETKKIGVYRPDFIIEDRILLELKALPFVGNIEKRQIWHYLKSSDYRLALLVNFSPRGVSVDRIIYDVVRKSAFHPHTSAYSPHLLSMTATPIPRTLALTIYGDLDISVLNEMPKGRTPVETKLIPPSKRKEAYKFIREQVKSGRQVFVICPRIEIPNFKSQITNKSQISNPKTARQLSLKDYLNYEVKAVKAEYEKLSEDIFKDLRVSMLHGKMKSKEKEEIMAKFKNRESDILVSTSVIEVGVDVPNAVIMMIEGAEHFGLAQLHQFRGRVGRGEHKSYCILFTESPLVGSTRRLEALLKTNDGFKLAEMDLKIRGPGEFTGTRQSGIPDLAMASLADIGLIKKARAEAKLVLKNLNKYPLISEKLGEFNRKIHFE